MANQARPTSGKEKLFEQTEIAADEIEDIEIIEISQHGSLYDRISMLMEKFASNRLGQLVIEKTDRVLKIIEDTAKWSLPQDDSDILLERPLPWIFFLTLIVWLRIFRIWLSVAAYLMGLQPITPFSIVYFIQTQRRRLRAIKVRGLKSIRDREIETTVMSGSNKNVTFMKNLQKLFSSAICKPGLQRESSAKCVFAKDGKIVKDVAERSFEKILSDEVVQNLTVSEMLDKFANEDSDDDSDYIPKEDESDDDQNSTSHTSSFSAEDSEEPTEQEAQKETVNRKEEEEIKENGETKHVKPKSFKQGFMDNNMTADKDNEQTHTPREISAKADKEEVHTPKEITNRKTSNHEAGQANELPVMTAAVAPQTALNTPKTILNHLVVPDENKKKSTPGHESAAALKLPSLPTTSAGSLQDFHSIFHPGPLINGATGEAKSSTPKESDQYESSASNETTETTAANNQKKYFNYSTHKHNNHHNVKNRNKNHR